MLAERIEIYKKYKDDKEKLYSYKYKTEKQYKEEFPFLKEAVSRALQYSRIDLNTAYKNFFNNLRKGRNPGFPKFKSKHRSKLNYKEPQIVYPGKTPNAIEVIDNKIKLSKIKWIKFRGLSKNFQGKIKSVTITKSRSGKYFASVLTELENSIKKKRVSDNTIGIDLGLKEFATCSNGEQITGIKQKLYKIEGKIKVQQRHISRKKKGSRRRQKAILKLNKLYEYKTNFSNHFQWHLANKLCSENQAISLENLNVSGMIKNRKLAHAIHTVNWSSFVCKLEQKAEEYETEIHKVDRFFPSSKLCSKCGSIKVNLALSDRTYICDCGNNLDRDLNAAVNIRNSFLIKNKSLKSDDHRHGENVRPIKIIYNSNGQFSVKCLKKVS